MRTNGKLLISANKLNITKLMNVGIFIATHIEIQTYYLLDCSRYFVKYPLH